MGRPFEEVLEDYVELFKAEPPMPFGVSDEQVGRAMETAIKQGEVIPDDFDWWRELPKGADA